MTLNYTKLCNDITKLSPKELHANIAVWQYVKGKVTTHAEINLHNDFVQQATDEAIRLLNPTLRREPNRDGIAQQIRMAYLFDLNTKLLATGLYETTTVIGENRLELIVTDK